MKLVNGRHSERLIESSRLTSRSARNMCFSYRHTSNDDHLAIRKIINLTTPTQLQREANNMERSAYTIDYVPKKDSWRSLVAVFSPSPLIKIARRSSETETRINDRESIAMASIWFCCLLFGTFQFDFSRRHRGINGRLIDPPPDDLWLSYLYI